MKIGIVASTIDYDTLEELFKNEDLSYDEIALRWREIQKKSFDKFGGQAGGICYMPDTWETLSNESEEKSLRRSAMTKASGHHSTQSHAHVSLVIENCSKFMAMLLNNEHEYVTSEKSARYTRMSTEGETNELYTKWTAIYKEILDTKHPEMDEKRRKKLAMENARYLISVFNPSTIMMYTTSYRQLNYLYYWAKDLADNMEEFLSKKGDTPIEDEMIRLTRPRNFYEKLKPELESFCEELEKTGLIDPNLRDDKNRTFTLINYVPVEKRYGASFETSFLASFASLAQIHRHRTLYCNFSFTNANQFYIPKMIRDNEELVEAWKKDMEALSDGYPQGMQVLATVRGTKEAAVLFGKERLCDCTQQETFAIARNLLMEYADAVRDNPLPFYNDIKKINGCARCTWGYKCATPCGNKEGILGTRDY